MEFSAKLKGFVAKVKIQAKKLRRFYREISGF